MKKLIKKISMVSTGLSIVATGGFVGIINNGVTKTISLQSMVLPRFGVTGGAARNRYYNLVLTMESTINLNNILKVAPTSTIIKGDIIYHFLMSSNSRKNINGWKFGSDFYNIANNYSDSMSIHSLLKMDNTHTWLNSFDLVQFINVLSQDIKEHKQLKMIFNVDYKFLAHNLYGVVFV